MSDRQMTRRSFLAQGAMAAIAGAGLWACSSSVGDSEHGVNIDPRAYLNSGKGRVDPAGVIQPTKAFHAKKPNIIIVLCDDLGWGDLGCYGNTAIRTPQIDALAKNGLRFTDFYASCSVCTPSRYGLLTGRYPVRSGLIFVMPASGESLTRFLLRRAGRWVGRLGAVDVQDDCWVEGLTDDEITMAGALKVAGYRTGMVGKWHLGDFSTQPRYNPRRHGFDAFFGLPHSNDMWPCALYRNETQLEADIGLNQARLTALYTKEATDFINKSKDGPFFLYLAHTFPHQPLHASERFKDKSKVGIYGDAVEEIDWSMGEIMSCLKKNGIAEDTIILFTSDNGPWYNGNPGGLRGRKGQSYEGGFRVPLIVNWPREIKAGAVCREPAMNIDLFPTLMPLAGLQLPADRIIDGKSLLGIMTGKEKKSPHDALYFYHYEELEGVRAGNWKYFRNINHYVWPQPVDKKTTLFGKLAKGNLADSPNLYNFEVDGGENYNQAERYPDICRRMEGVMSAWEREIGKNPRGWVNR